MFYPQHIYVERCVTGSPLTKTVLERCPGIPATEIGDARDLIRDHDAAGTPISEGKKLLLLCANKGRFLELCPGTKKPYRCCLYRILNIGTGCPFDCTYCILQTYLNNPIITLYANLHDMHDELARSLDPNRHDVIRIGTGEYMDSLALEHLTGFCSYILPFFQSQQGVILELKTKTAHVEPLLSLDNTSSFIISWSLNAARVSESEEHGAAAVNDRIRAARQVVEKGYRVGFHFDPVIYHHGWENGYEEVIHELGRRIPPDAIVWISIGSLRYMPALKHTAQQRFPETNIFSDEFIPGLDAKMRYVQELRVSLYKHIISCIRRYYPDVCVYFCMENPTVWERCLGYVPSSNSELKKMLDRQIVKSM